MRSIVIPAQRSAEFENRLETALSLARVHHSHVTVLIDTPISQFVVTDMYGGPHVAADALREACEADVLLGQRLDSRLASQDVAFDIVERIDDPVEAVCDTALLADLIVADLAFPRLAELLVGTSTPVLALPPLRRPGAPDPMLLNRAAMIAWDGSRAAARALRAAIPLLRGFASVHVVSVRRKADTEFPQTDALHYLARHDIRAEYRECVAENSIEETLFREAARLDAQLLVMGAFGHSRLREFLTGGVTRYFLTGKAVPLFLAN